MHKHILVELAEFALGMRLRSGTGHLQGIDMSYGKGGLFLWMRNVLGLALFLNGKS